MHAISSVSSTTPSAIAALRGRALSLLTLFALSLALWTAVPGTAGAAPGDLLTSFGNQGIFAEGVAQGDLVRDALLHPDLGLVLAIFEPQNTLSGTIRILRLDPVTGAVLQSQSYPDVVANRDVRLADDRAGGLVVGATVTVAAGNDDLWLVRLTDTLALRLPFGTQQVPFDMPGGGEDILEDIEVLPDGRVVALAQVDTNVGIRPGLAYLNANGTYDATIDNGGFPDGRQLAPFAVVGDVVPQAMVVDAMGRITLGGTWFGTADTELAFARMLPDGNADGTFGSGGVLTYPYFECLQCTPYPGMRVEDLAIRDGEVYAAVLDWYGSDVAVTRLTASGGVDISFGGWRRFSFPTPSGSPFAGWPMDGYQPSLAVDPNRPGVFVGLTTVENNDEAYVSIARLQWDGTFDPSFGTAGQVTYSFGLGLVLGDVYLVIDEEDPAGGYESNAIAAVSVGVVGLTDTEEVSALAVQGRSTLLFADGFESGGLTAWSAHVP